MVTSMYVLMYSMYVCMYLFIFLIELFYLILNRDNTLINTRTDVHHKNVPDFTCSSMIPMNINYTNKNKTIKSFNFNLIIDYM